MTDSNKFSSRNTQSIYHRPIRVMIQSQDQDPSQVARVVEAIERALQAEIALIPNEQIRDESEVQVHLIQVSVLPHTDKKLLRSLIDNTRQIKKVGGDQIVDPRPLIVSIDVH